MAYVEKSLHIQDAQQHNVGSQVNLGKEIFLTVLNVITSMMWGEMVEGGERTVNRAEFREVVSGITEILGKPNVSDFFPVLSWLDLQGLERKMMILAKRLDQTFEKMIDRRIKVNKESSGSEGEESTDFFQFLLKLKVEPDSKIQFSMIHVKPLLMVCFLHFFMETKFG